MAEKQALMEIEQRSVLNQTQLYPGQSQPFTGPTQPYAGPTQPYPGPTQPYYVQAGTRAHPGAEAVYNPQTQMVYVTPGAASSRRDNYNGRLSLIFGVSLIVLQTVALAIGCSVMLIQKNRQYSWLNPIALVFPAAWGCVLMYVVASFAIVAGKKKTRGYIITTMVVSIIACVFECLFMAMAVTVMAFDSADLCHNDEYYDKVSLSLHVVQALIAIVMLVMSIWLSTLGCKVLCATTTTTVIVAEPMQVVLLGDGVTPSAAAQSQELHADSPPPYYSEAPPDVTK